ncbi:hypothetical protein [Streptomyces sp. NPDC002758]
MPYSAGPGTGSSVPSFVVFRTALRERHAVQPDERPCPHLGSVAAIGVQTSWILFSGLHGLRRKRRVEVAGRLVNRIPLLARDAAIAGRARAPAQATRVDTPHTGSHQGG